MGDIKLFVGLGNRGDEYARNRHNVGFMAVDAIAGEDVRWREKFSGLFAQTTIDGNKVLLLKPQTFMNESGRSVAALARFYKIPPQDIYVFHDELDLAPSKIRIKCGGGNAGHNGLKSIQAHLGTPDFWRIRLGIGRPQDRASVHNYVLGNFAKTDKEWLCHLLDGISSHANLLVTEKNDLFMNRICCA